MSSPLLAGLLAATSVPTLTVGTNPMLPAAPAAPAAYSTRFQMLINALLERFPADLTLVQFWTLPRCREWRSLSKQQLREITARTHENPCSVNDPGLAGFRLKCCEQGIQGEAMGMLGKAWSTGALMMVQVADTLPKGFHPRTKLEGNERVGEVVFIPVYDRSYPNSGVRAVMEVMMQKGAAEPMAEVITYISSALNLLQLSLKQPMSERQHPCGSSRLPFPALMQTGASPQQQQHPTGSQRASSPTSPAATAVSPFAMCSSSFGSTFQQPPRCVPNSGVKLCSPPGSRVASPTSVLEGDYMLDDAVTPARRVNSMSRTISMRNVSGCLPEFVGV